MSATEWITCKNGHKYDPDKPQCPYCPQPVASSAPERRKTPTGGATIVEAGAAQAAPPPPTLVPDSKTVVQTPSSDARTHVVGDPAPPAPVSAAGHEGRGTRVISDVAEDVKRMPIFAWLVVLQGKQQYLDFRIDQERVCIGSSPDCGIVLDDEFISGEHASIRHRDGKFFITDLDSVNGTHVNDFAPEARIDRVQLSDGDEIQMGQVRMKFKCL